jgi:hypothetical protein
MRFIYSVLVFFTLVSCSSNQVGFRSEIQYEVSGARPRIEQRALTYAMESAFQSVNFEIFNDKTAFVEVQGLSDRDLEFVKIYIENRIVASGGRVFTDQENAEYRVSMVLNVLGGDKVGTNYYIFSTEKLVGEFTGRFSVVTKEGELVTNQLLSSEQSEKLR